MSYDTRKTRCGLNQSLHAQRMKCTVGADSPMTVAGTVGAVVKARSVLTDGACDQKGLRIVFAMTSQKTGAIPLDRRYQLRNEPASDFSARPQGGATPK